MSDSIYFLTDKGRIYLRTPQRDETGEPGWIDHGIDKATALRLWDELNDALLMSPSPGDPIDIVVDDQKVGEITGSRLTGDVAQPVASVDAVVNCPPWCDVCNRFHRPGEKCGGKLTGGLSR